MNKKEAVSIRNTKERFSFVPSCDWIIIFNLITEYDEKKQKKNEMDSSDEFRPGAAAALTAAVKKKGAAKALAVDCAASREKSRSDAFVGYAGVLYK